MHIVTIAKGKSSGHDLCPGVSPATGSNFVFVNKSPVCTIGDKMENHGSPIVDPHQDVISTGSSIVFIQHIPVAFVTSNTDRGDTLVQGDSLVDIKA